MMNTTPRVNLNGSGVRTLLDDAQKIWSALDDSIKAMRQAYPHGRDWQTEADDSVYRKARTEWEARILPLEGLQNFISSHVSEIYRQETVRRAHNEAF